MFWRGRRGAGAGEVVVWKGTHWPDNVPGQSAETALVHRGPYVSGEGGGREHGVRMAVNMVPRQEGKSHREADCAMGTWSIASVHVAKALPSPRGTNGLSRSRSS